MEPMLTYQTLSFGRFFSKGNLCSRHMFKPENFIIILFILSSFEASILNAQEIKSEIPFQATLPVKYHNNQQDTTCKNYERERVANLIINNGELLESSIYSYSQNKYDLFIIQRSIKLNESINEYSIQAITIDKRTNTLLTKKLLINIKNPDESHQLKIYKDDIIIKIEIYSEKKDTLHYEFDEKNGLLYNSHKTINNFNQNIAFDSLKHLFTETTSFYIHDSLLLNPNGKFCRIPDSLIFFNGLKDLKVWNYKSTSVEAWATYCIKIDYYYVFFYILDYQDILTNQLNYVIFDSKNNKIAMNLFKLNGIVYVEYSDNIFTLKYKSMQKEYRIFEDSAFFVPLHAR
jgi:hypothetical protein